MEKTFGENKEEEEEEEEEEVKYLQWLSEKNRGEETDHQGGEPLLDLCVTQLDSPGNDHDKCDEHNDQ